MSIRVGSRVISNSQTAESLSNRNTAVDPNTVYNWTGTLAQYEALDGYNANWLYYITDDETGGTAGCRCIGDIFYSTRLDNTLAGAVRCNGNTYVISDFIGKESIGNLLNSNKVPHVDLATYASEIAQYGKCKSFGWNMGASTFRVPTLPDTVDGYHAFVQILTGIDEASFTDSYSKRELKELIDNKVNTIFNTLYPVGGLYLTQNETCPMSEIMVGTVWQISPNIEIENVNVFERIS